MLHIKRIVKNWRLSQAIADVGWRGLLTKVDYKRKPNGDQFANRPVITPSKPVAAGARSLKILPRKQRRWLCTTCHTVHDWDTSASRNIEQQSVLQLKAAEVFVSAHRGCVRLEHCALAAVWEVGSARLQAERSHCWQTLAAEMPCVLLVSPKGNCFNLKTVQTV